MSGDGASSRSASGNPNCAERWGLGAWGKRLGRELLPEAPISRRMRRLRSFLSPHMANFVKNCGNGSYFGYC